MSSTLTPVRAVEKFVLIGIDDRQCVAPLQLLEVKAGVLVAVRVEGHDALFALKILHDGPKAPEAITLLDFCQKDARPVLRQTRKFTPGREGFVIFQIKIACHGVG